MKISANKNIRPLFFRAFGLFNQTRKAGFFTAGGVAMPDMLGRRAVQSAANGRKLLFRLGNLARFERLNELFDTVAHDRTGRPIAKSQRLILFESLFGTFRVWHGILRSKPCDR